MSVSKVVYSGETLIDLTSDTVYPSALADGYTAHDASGRSITGTFGYAAGSNIDITGNVISAKVPALSVSGTRLTITTN